MLIGDIFLRFILIIFLLTTSARSQERPDIVKKLMDRNIHEQSVTIANTLTSKEKAFYWKNKTKNSDGIIETTASIDYLNLVYAMLAISQKRNDAFSNRFSLELASSDILSELIESSNRSNYFFELNSGVAMLTVWDFEADGAKILLLKDFLNVQNFYSTASLVLVKNKESSNKQLWKLSWINKNIQYELYIPDTGDSTNKSSLKKDDILNLARKFVKN